MDKVAEEAEKVKKNFQDTYDQTLKLVDSILRISSQREIKEAERKDSLRGLNVQAKDGLNMLQSLLYTLDTLARKLPSADDIEKARSLALSWRIEIRSLGLSLRHVKLQANENMKKAAQQERELHLGGVEECTARMSNLQTKVGMTSAAERITESIRRTRQLMVQEVERSTGTIMTFGSQLTSGEEKRIKAAFRVPSQYRVFKNARHRKWADAAGVQEGVGDNSMFIAPYQLVDRIQATKTFVTKGLSKEKGKEKEVNPPLLTSGEQDKAQKRLRTAGEGVSESKRPKKTLKKKDAAKVAPLQGGVPLEVIIAELPPWDKGKVRALENQVIREDAFPTFARGVCRGPPWTANGDGLRASLCPYKKTFEGSEGLRQEIYRADDKNGNLRRELEGLPEAAAKEDLVNNDVVRRIMESEKARYLERHRQEEELANTLAYLEKTAQAHAKETERQMKKVSYLRAQRNDLRETLAAKEKELHDARLGMGLDEGDIVAIFKSKPAALARKIYEEMIRDKVCLEILARFPEHDLDLDFLRPKAAESSNPQGATTEPAENTNDIMKQINDTMKQIKFDDIETEHVNQVDLQQAEDASFK